MFKTLQEIRVVSRYLVRDALSGLFSSRFLKNSKFRNGLILVVVGGYLLYFYVNSVATQKLLSGNASVSNSVMQETIKVTVGSFYTMFFIFGVIMYAFLNTTLNYNHQIVYVLKCLPFDKKSVCTASSIFKCCVALVPFELVFIIVSPIAGVFQNSFFDLVFFILSVHGVYLITFLFVDVIYRILLGWCKTIKMVMDVFCIVAATLFLFTYRYKMDAYIASQIDSLHSLFINTTFIAFGVVVSILLLGTTFLGIQVVFENKYVNVKGFVKLRLQTTAPAFIRSKKFLYVLTLEIIFTVILGICFEYNQLMHGSSKILLLINVAGLYYADATEKIRLFFKQYGVSSTSEFMSLVTMGVIFQVPLIVMCVAGYAKLQDVIIGSIIYVSSLLSGFLFPKSGGTLNEMSASFFMLVTLALFCGALYMGGWVAILFSVILELGLYFMIKRGREWPE